MERPSTPTPSEHADSLMMGSPRADSLSESLLSLPAQPTPSVGSWKGRRRARGQQEVVGSAASSMYDRASASEAFSWGATSTLSAGGSSSFLMNLGKAPSFSEKSDWSSASRRSRKDEPLGNSSGVMLCTQDEVNEVSWEREYLPRWVQYDVLLRLSTDSLNSITPGTWKSLFVGFSSAFLCSVSYSSWSIKGPQFLLKQLAQSFAEETQTDIILSTKDGEFKLKPGEMFLLLHFPAAEFVFGRPTIEADGEGGVATTKFVVYRRVPGADEFSIKDVVARGEMRDVFVPNPQLEGVLAIKHREMSIFPGSVSLTDRICLTPLRARQTAQHATFNSLHRRFLLPSRALRLVSPSPSGTVASTLVFIAALVLAIAFLLDHPGNDSRRMGECAVWCASLGIAAVLCRVTACIADEAAVRCAMSAAKGKVQDPVAAQAA